MVAPNFPVKFDHIRAKISFEEDCYDSYRFGSIAITPIALSHPNRGTGYKFIEDGKCFVFLTDNELSFRHDGGLDFQNYLEFSRGADLLFHDAEYKEEEYKKTQGWGHSYYTEALRLALEAGVKRLGLFHHNQERTDSEVDDIVGHCRKIIKKSGRRLECFGVGQYMEFRL